MSSVFSNNRVFNLRPKSRVEKAVVVITSAIAIYLCAIVQRHHESPISCQNKKSHCTLLEPKTEHVFISLVTGLFGENIVPPGSVLDIGASEGDWSCYFSCIETSRTFYAVDPNPMLRNSLPCNHHNLEVVNMAMSDVPGKIQFDPTQLVEYVGSLEDKQSNQGNVIVTTLDTFFREREQPGFLHLDVEGYELPLLKGGVQILRSQEVLFSFEVHVSKNVDIFLFIENLGYTIFMINEICGAMLNCRNFLAVPESLIRQFMSSATFKMAFYTGGIYPVKATSAFQIYNQSEKSAFPVNNGKHLGQIQEDLYQSEE